MRTLLDRHHYQLIDVARRQYVMEALTKELNRVTRGRTFRIANGVTWLMMLDSVNVLVIHLASWARGVYQPGGLIGQLRADHLRSFPRTRPPEPRDGEWPGWRERRDREHGESFGRLFPNATGAHPDRPAFEGLTDAFAIRMKPAIDARHDRAHLYEVKGPGAAKMLDVSELRALVDYGDRFVQDLRMVSEGSSLHHEDMNSPKAEDVAPDIVDSLLLGTSDQIARVREGQERDAYYDQLHAEHDSLPPQQDRFFNDRLFTRKLDLGSGLHRLRHAGRTT